ncbi:MAG: hypothetical protein AAF770_03900 [Bacteroidota bacterium]
MKRIVSIDIINSKIIATPYVQTKDLVWIGSEHVTSYENIAFLVDDLKNLLAYSKTGIANQKRSKIIHNSMELTLKIAGLHSYSMFEKVAKVVDIEEENGVVTISPIQHTLIDDYDFSCEQEEVMLLDDKQKIIQALERSIAQCVSLEEEISNLKKINLNRGSHK